MTLRAILLISIYSCLAVAQTPEPLKEITVDICSPDQLTQQLNSTNWSAEKESFAVIFKGCGLFNSRYFKSSRRVEQQLIKKEKLQSLMNEALIGDATSTLMQIQRFSESHVGAWIIRYRKKSFTRFMVLNSEVTLAGPHRGTLPALYELVEAAKKELQTDRQPDQIHFIRRNSVMNTLILPSDQELFFQIQNIFDRPNLAFTTFRDLKGSPIFHLHNFNERTQPLYISNHSVEEKQNRLNQARAASLKYLAISKDRILASEELKKALSEFGRANYLLKLIDSTQRRLPHLIWNVSEGPEDFARCWRGKTIAFTYLKVVKVPQLNYYKTEPKNKFVVFCDYAFLNQFKPENDLAVIVLHEAIHQTGVVDEKTATFFSNLIHIIATGQTVSNPGYKETFNFSMEFERFKNIIHKEFLP